VIRLRFRPRPVLRETAGSNARPERRSAGRSRAARGHGHRTYLGEDSPRASRQGRAATRQAAEDAPANRIARATFFLIVMKSQYRPSPHPPRASSARRHCTVSAAMHWAEPPVGTRRKYRPAVRPAATSACTLPAPEMIQPAPAQRRRIILRTAASASRSCSTAEQDLLRCVISALCHSDVKSRTRRPQRLAVADSIKLRPPALGTASRDRHLNAPKLKPGTDAGDRVRQGVLDLEELIRTGLMHDNRENARRTSWPPRDEVQPASRIHRSYGDQ